MSSHIDSSDFRPLIAPGGPTKVRAMPSTEMIKEGLSYLKSHPAFLFTAARNAARMSLSIPLDLLRWGIDKRPRGKGPERIDLNAAQGGFNVGLTVDLYGTKIDVSSGLHIESIENAVDSLRIALR